MAMIVKGNAALVPYASAAATAVAAPIVSAFVSKVEAAFQRFNQQSIQLGKGRTLVVSDNPHSGTQWLKQKLRSFSPDTVGHPLSKVTGQIVDRNGQPMGGPFEMARLFHQGSLLAVKPLAKGRFLVVSKDSDSAAHPERISTHAAVFSRHGRRLDKIRIPMDAHLIDSKGDSFTLSWKEGWQQYNYTRSGLRPSNP